MAVPFNSRRLFVFEVAVFLLEVLFRKHMRHISVVTTDTTPRHTNVRLKSQRNPPKPQTPNPKPQTPFKLSVKWQFKVAIKVVIKVVLNFLHITIRTISPNNFQADRKCKSSISSFCLQEECCKPRSSNHLG